MRFHGDQESSGTQRTSKLTTCQLDQDHEKTYPGAQVYLAVNAQVQFSELVFRSWRMCINEKQCLQYATTVSKRTPLSRLTFVQLLQQARADGQIRADVDKFRVTERRQ